MKCNTNCNNCEPDDCEYFTVDVLNDISLESDLVESVTIIEENTCNETTSDSNNSSPVSNNSSPDINDKPSLETCSVVYFAGYLAKKCVDRFPCEDCKINLTKKKR